MNQASQVLTTLIHYNVAVRDTLEYCLVKEKYDENLFKEKKRSVLVEVNEHTPLKDIIDHEDKSHPLTDMQLEQEIKKRGFQTKRRTIVKYREQMNIPKSTLRRQ